MKIQSIAKLAHKFNPIIKLLPKSLQVLLHSSARLKFMDEFVKNTGASFVPDSKWQRTLWGLKFQSPLMNSAGMFKNGDGYDVVISQGAGGYIGGTSTYNPRTGNIKHGIKLPFITLPNSHVSINTLGLPNLGDEILSKKVITNNKTSPIGWSLMRSPDYEEHIGLENLIKSLWMYHDNPQIDFIEINESCPNISVNSENITNRLVYIAEHFLSKRTRHLPVVVKLSTDTGIEVLKQILDVLFQKRYDGVNLGNTSTNYSYTRQYISPTELAIYDYYTKNFSGGIGGISLRDKSFILCDEAIKYREFIKPDYEFHVIRSGGVFGLDNIKASDAIGISMNQWYTGYFTNYLQNGGEVYKREFSS
jgi:dihydroorotate dehydrogenase